MLVYGDHTVQLSIQQGLTRLTEVVRSAPTGIAGHAHLVAALIMAGQMAQAVADDPCLGGIDAGAAERALMGMTARLALAVGRSWDDGFPSGVAIPTVDPGQIGLDPEATLTLRLPEGFAHYALYPEAYWRAGRLWGGGRGGPRVVGIRSIGTTLAAMVAASVGAALPVTVRPVGHPFDRTLGDDPIWPDGDLPQGDIAVVDEGPGLSGSSFGAVADRLERDGVERPRIVFFPSHSNEPGSQAAARHRDRWRTARRHVVSFEDLLLRPDHPAHRLDDWFEDLTGPALAPLEDIAGGRWRQHHSFGGKAVPPADGFAERRKFLLRAENGRFLLKFTGLGDHGLRALAMQQRLGDAGFAVPPSAWRHGFVAEPWRSECVPLSVVEFDRRATLARLAAYLGFRVRSFPADGRSGATLPALLGMLAANTGEAVGEWAGTAMIERWRPRLSALAPRRQPIITDNRLHRWEWLVTPDGHLLKTDAVDHHAGHDLIGCQDVAWDIAGAAVEFDLTEDERRWLVEAVAHAGGLSVSAELVGFHLEAYAAFQLGAARLAADRNPEDDRRRWTAQAERYQAALRRTLA